MKKLTIPNREPDHRFLSITSMKEYWFKEMVRSADGCVEELCIWSGKLAVAPGGKDKVFIESIQDAYNEWAVEHYLLGKE